MVITSRVARRVAASVVLAALAAPLFGALPAAASAPPETVTVEAVCPAPAPGHSECLALRRTDIPAQPASAMTPNSTPSGFGPADIQSAYALPGGSAGSGLTVAVVDAYDLPTAEADLAAYRSQFGLPECTTDNGCFRKVNQAGEQDSYPAANAAWGAEIALDIDMVSAACPYCNILLVEANSSLTTDLGASVNTAVSLGAVAVSNSYGGPESSYNAALDAAFFNHPGVAITASTGDCGWECALGPSGFVQAVQYPAASRYVVAVGGTRLVRDGSARGWTETAWGTGPTSGAGSGCSLYESKPSWQRDAECGNRTQADVSAVADGATPVAVYYSGTWGTFGGTSVASPIIASVYALAGGPAAGTYPASYLYAAVSGLNDVVGGNNDVHWGNCPIGSYLCNGVAGYDGPTGLGTPNGIAAFTADRSGSTYVPLNPSRLLDSRNGTGLSGPFSSHVARTFQVANRGGVPAGAVAVTGNLTVTAQTSSGYLFVGPNATNNPTSSTLNFPVGDDRANGVTVALGAGGTLSVTYVASAGVATAHVIFDVTGYFVPDASGSKYVALNPSRLLDSRNGTGLSGPFSSHVARTFAVAGVGGVPANATSVTGNLTVTAQTGNGYLFVGPNATNNPTSSTLNFPVGDDRANGVTVALGAGGTLSVTFVASAGVATAHVIFDVTGYFVPGSSGSAYIPLNPSRLLDSRNGTGLSGPFASHVSRTFAVANRGGVPADAVAVTGNLTVTAQSSNGYHFIGPNATNNPTSSTLNFPVGDDRANGVTVALGGGGTLSVTYVASAGVATAHAIFDVTGYFAP